MISALPSSSWPHFPAMKDHALVGMSRAKKVGAETMSTWPSPMGRPVQIKAAEGPECPGLFDSVTVVSDLISLKYRSFVFQIKRGA